MPYTVPDSDITAIIDAPPTPLAAPAPGGRYIALLRYESHPPVAALARPLHRLAGLRLDPVIGGRQRTRRFTGMDLITVSDGTQTELDLPPGAQVSAPVWAPDGSRFACTVDEPDGIGVWAGDARTGKVHQVAGLRVRDVLGSDPPYPGGTLRWSRDGRSLFALGAPPDRGPGSWPDLPEPRTDETIGKQSQLATFQDLLRTPADEDLFEHYATSVPLRVDPETGATVELGPAGLYQYLADSPDGAYLLVFRLIRPFSFRVPCGYFARRKEVWSAAGKLIRVVADLPVSDEVPRQGVPTGPRQLAWDERAPARLIWTEALDGGDPVAPAEYRDAIWKLAAPFDGEAELAFKVRNRCLGWTNLDRADRLLLDEHDRDRRWLTSWECDLAAPEENRVLFDLADDDSYADPGSPVGRLHPDGTRTILQDGSAIFLRGEGATPDGDRPFLDRFDLESGSSERLFRSAGDALESVLGFAEGTLTQLLIWHQSPASPPNLRVVTLPGSTSRPLTSWPDPHPQLTGIAKQLILTDRGDGVRLSGMLHLPPGYQPEHGPLPLVIWAYPYDYGSSDTAGQVRDSAVRFTRLTAGDPAWFVLRGYAVLNNATMPVIGDPETKNDTYVEQISAAAAAHIRAVADLGIADPARVAVGGHSYGAFMTANLLAHTDLFRAGIARSGAYNRTLTPFGFQTERRSLWEVPAVYDRVSPFRYADQISAPLLLVHGADDNNSGTFPVQSERLFQAIAGLGGTARLVVLPHEGHGYLARESVLHVLAEQFSWLARWLG